jgi:hypothetical protein
MVSGSANSNSLKNSCIFIISSSRKFYRTTLAISSL